MGCVSKPRRLTSRLSIGGPPRNELPRPSEALETWGAPRDGRPGAKIHARSAPNARAPWLAVRPPVARRAEGARGYAVAMDVGEVRACLERDGWPIEAVSESTLRSQFRRGGRVFPLLVHVGEAFVTFAVIPYARVPDEPEGVDLLARRLLHLNRDLNLAKFSVDEDGDVALCVEYRRAELDPSEVRDAVDVLSYYAERHHLEVARLSGPAA